MNEEEKKQLEEKWLKIGKDLAFADIALIQAYADISEKAKAGKFISADDFNKAENAYNKENKRISRELFALKTDPALTKEQVSTLALEAKTVIDIIETEWKKENAEVVKQSTEPTYIQQQFINQYTHPEIIKFAKEHGLEKAYPEKKLSVDYDIRTTQELAVNLLSKNNGIAIADLHSAGSAPYQFISQNIKKFKAAGVDTIFVEGDSYGEILSKLSLEDLKKQLNERTPEEIEQGKKLFSKYYHVDNPSDLDGDTLKMFIVAKENGIRVVNIDKKGAARQLELDEHRVASTNYVWTENIEKDLASRPNHGKYILISGGGHLASINGVLGLVDERLGIPVIGFEKRDPKETPAFLRGEDQHDPDFYIAGGKCYINTRFYYEESRVRYSLATTSSEDLDKAIIINLTSTGTNNRFYKETDMSCKNADHAEKTPQSTPSNQPQARDWQIKR